MEAMYKYLSAVIVKRGNGMICRKSDNCIRKNNIPNIIIFDFYTCRLYILMRGLSVNKNKNGLVKNPLHSSDMDKYTVGSSVEVFSEYTRRLHTRKILFVETMDNCYCLLRHL